MGKKGSGLSAAKQAQYAVFAILGESSRSRSSPAIKGAMDFEVMARYRLVMHADLLCTQVMARHRFIIFTDQQHESDTNVMKMKALLDDEARFQLSAA